MMVKKALVVEDATDSALLLARVLKMLGWEAQIAGDPFAALAIVERETLSLIFMDIGLPDMDGYELVRRLRALPRGREAIVVAISGFAPPANRVAMRALGFDHYLTKPVSIAVLKGLLVDLETAALAPYTAAGTPQLDL